MCVTISVCLVTTQRWLLKGHQGNNITGVQQKIEVRSNEQVVQYQNNYTGKVMALTSNTLSYYLEKEKIKGLPIRMKEVHNVNTLLSTNGIKGLL